jgi:hypothetical protein
MNDELGGVWKELIMVCFKIVMQNFLELMKENYEKPCQNSQSSS